MPIELTNKAEYNSVNTKNMFKPKYVSNTTNTENSKTVLH